MKAIKLTVFFLFLPIIFYAQTLTGLWMGSVTNDSTTIRKDQSFEVVLTQYKDKVYGYSRSTFTVNDTLYYIVKRVKGSIEGDVCEVKDDDIVSYNFKGRLDKGVKMVTTFHFDHGDSTWRMDGDWKTNKTKKYYSLSGKATLNQEKDLTKSKIFPHLEELKLADDVDFYKEAKQAEEVAKKEQEKKEQEKKKQELAKSTKPVVSQPKETKTNANDVAVNKQPETVIKPVAQPKETVSNSIAQAEKPAPKDQSAAKTVATNNTAINTPAKSEPVVQVQPPPAKPTVDEKKTIASAQAGQPVSKDQNATKTVATNNTATNVPAKSEPIVRVQQPPAKETIQQNQEPKKSEALVVTKPVEQKKEPVIETPKPETKVSIVAADKKETDKQQPVSMFAETKPATASAALFIKERVVAAPQVVNFKSDSLELALYDNGEVDGDTVSVLLNGQLILAKQGLKASAIKKTIYAPANNNDSLTMVLYAENLGKYPPNTGLLIIHDGNDTYQVRFSADLQQNAAVIFKRKRN